MTTISINYDKIPTDLTWIEFNFDDISVIAGELYYMVMYTQTKYNTIYGVGMGSNNPYPHGSFWGSIDGQEWDEGWNDDFCFKTYGIGEPPNKPSIKGPSSGKTGEEYEFIFNAVDPDGDNLHYYIDWDDGTFTGWIGPYDSGTDVIKSHTWSKQGTYTIKCKARDSYNAESPWGEFVVKMPRYRMLSNSLFLWFLERFPLLERILSYLK